MANIRRCSYISLMVGGYDLITDQDMESKGLMMSTENNMVTVTIQDLAGNLVRAYRAHEVERRNAELILEAQYDGQEQELGDTTLEPGDRLLIRFYENRLYNVVQIHDGDDDQLKGWHCNFMRPASIDNGAVSAQDLSLSVFVRPDRGNVVLNRPQFQTLDIDEDERRDVKDTLAALIQQAEENAPPFGNMQPTLKPDTRRMPGSEENLVQDPKHDIDPDAPKTAH